MIRTHILGFPRIGAQRELKFALERYWRGESSLEQLEAVGRELRARHWALQAEAGLDCVSVGDFAWYDHVASYVQMFGCEPARFGFTPQQSDLERLFTLGRGVSEEPGGCTSGDGHVALEMTKWFDTNYHYLVPEFLPDTAFSLHAQRLLDELAEARAQGHRTKVSLVGPLSFLWLGKEKVEGFDRLELLDGLLPVYGELLVRLREAGADWVQIDEPVLGLDLPDAWRAAIEPAYNRLAAAGTKIMLASYFSSLDENLCLACRLPVYALHVDAVRAPEELVRVADWLPQHKQLSVGILDGRNIWRTDLDHAFEVLRPIFERREGELWIAPSCSLLHVPVSLAGEDAGGLPAEVREWLAFATEKLEELNILRGMLTGDESVHDAAERQRAALQRRRDSERVHDRKVAERLENLPADADRRASDYALRRDSQHRQLNLPRFPTTTIGSFPQTDDIRAARAAYRRGELSEEHYHAAMRAEIAHAIARQEALGLDVLVHGEAERNDMVEYFGEQLNGFAFTANGWVQSYGSRCVKPPILFGDVSRPGPMTVAWARYAQSLTECPVKGMLTGPVTILQWSFVRDDQPRADTALQIAWAIREEVADLEAAGIGVIQIDEPAFREGLPLRRAGWQHYLEWAGRAFRISASAVADATQIHTHMCYSEFNDILPAIAALDADVITIETSRSDMELLSAFSEWRYPNGIGPGVYDIHSPRVPETAAMLRLLEKAVEVLPAGELWVNPDCGLKTRGWPETEMALAKMVEAARQLRVRDAAKAAA